jgi:beta-N-acetylhexosaminidase
MSLPGSRKKAHKPWRVDIWEKRRDLFPSHSLWQSVFGANLNRDGTAGSSVFGTRWNMDAPTLSQILDRPSYSKHYVVRDPNSNELLGLCATYWLPGNRGQLIGSLALLIVRPSHRNIGVGRCLHEVALNALSSDERMVSLQLGSIFPRIFPGLPVDLAPSSLEWFTNRGWKISSERFIFDLFLDLQHWSPRPETSSLAARVGLSFSVCQTERFDDFISFEGKYFAPAAYPGWLDEYSNLKATDDIADIILATIEGGDIVGAALVYSPLGNNQVSKDIPWPRMMGADGRVGGVACLSIHRKYHC